MHAIPADRWPEISSLPDLALEQERPARESWLQRLAGEQPPPEAR